MGHPLFLCDLFGKHTWLSMVDPEKQTLGELADIEQVLTVCVECFRGSGLSSWAACYRD